MMFFYAEFIHESVKHRQHMIYVLVVAVGDFGEVDVQCRKSAVFFESVFRYVFVAETETEFGVFYHLLENIVYDFI
jgi:hypothetical protein